MSPSPILVAYDGRCPSTLRTGVSLAQALGRGITFVTAYRYDPVSFSSRQLPPAGNEERFGRAQAIADAAAAGVDELDVDAIALPATDVRTAIVDVALEVDAVAVVVGPDLHGDVARNLIGSAACPVVVAPEDPRLVAQTLREIGVAYDGTAGARFALTAATDLAQRCGSRVHVIGVAPDPYHAADVEEAVRQAIDTGGGGHVPLVGDVLFGDVARQVREASHKLDLIVAGSHGRGRVGRALLGSVSAELIHLPTCPVMIVPPGVRRRAGMPLGLGSAAAS